MGSIRVYMKRINTPAIPNIRIRHDLNIFEFESTDIYKYIYRRKKDRKIDNYG